MARSETAKTSRQTHARPPAHRLACLLPGGEHRPQWWQQGLYTFGLAFQHLHDVALAVEQHTGYPRVGIGGLPLAQGPVQAGFGEQQGGQTGVNEVVRERR